MIDRIARLADLDRHTIVLSSVVVLGALMSIIDTTIVNIALETLSRELHSSLDDIQWVSTAYLLALSSVIPLTGWAAERFGPKRLWLGSVALFTLGSLLCALAWSTGSLVAFRVLQGMAGGMIMPVGVIVLAQAAGSSRMGRVMSVIGLPALLGPVIGPVLGGAILQWLDWRWIFLVNLPIGALGLALAWRLLPAGRAEGEGGRLDWVGLALLSPGSAAIVFGLSEIASRGGIGSTLAWAPIVAGLALVVAFVFHAMRTPVPLIDVRLLAGRVRYAAAATGSLVAGAALFGTLFVLPLYFQLARGESTLATGLLLAPQGLGAAATMPFAGRTTDRIGGGRVALAGLAAMIGATAVFTQVESIHSLALLEVALLVRGIGLGATIMPLGAAAYAALEGPEVPKATSALNVVRRIGGSVGTALLAVVLATAIAASVSGASGIEGLRELPPEQARVAAAALPGAFGTAFWWALGMTAVALLPVGYLAIVERRYDYGDGRPRGHDGGSPRARR